MARELPAGGPTQQQHRTGGAQQSAAATATVVATAAEQARVVAFTMVEQWWGHRPSSGDKENAKYPQVEDGKVLNESQ